MDTARLKRTWASVIRYGDDVPSYFYAHLFVTHPELRQMFPLTMNAQRDRLVSALGAVVSGVDDLGTVVPLVEQLGRDHRRFSVVPEHYDAVGASLLWTLAHFLGEEWTPEVAADWSAAYGVVASTMVGAAEASEKLQPAWWTAEVIGKERVSREIARLRLRTDEPLDYRPGQSMAMSVGSASRTWRFYTPANARRTDRTIDIDVAQIAGGVVSRELVSQTQPGDTIRIGAPVGTALVLDPDDDTDLLMVAGNTGLAPFLAHLDQLTSGDTTNGRRVHVVHGVRFAWNLYAAEQLSALAARASWFTYTPVVSDDPTFPGRRGLVGSAAAETQFENRYRAMVCGSPAMVGHTKAALARSSRPPEAILHEEFADSPVHGGTTTAGEPVPASGGHA